MYVPGVHASSEPQTFVVTAPAGRLAMRLVTVTLWLLAGAALTAGAYWSFLITPESTVWTLAASALLLLTAAFLAAVTISGAIVGWQHGVSSSHLRTAMAGVPAVIPGARHRRRDLVAGRQRHRPRHHLQRPHQRAGSLPRFGWDDVSWLFTGIDWLAAWLKWVVAPMLALSVMAGILADGWRTLAGTTWIARALAPLPLGIATLRVRALVAAPWLYLTPWRPAGLPATSVELAFIIAKLSLTALLMAVGVALIIRQATPKLRSAVTALLAAVLGQITYLPRMVRNIEILPPTPFKQGRNAVILCSQS